MGQSVAQPTIKLGAKGDAVKRLQRALHRFPFPEVVVDGVFGPATEQVVKFFQSNAPIPLAVDGVAGPQTWDSLPDGGPMPVLQQGSKSPAVKPLQEVLSGAGVATWDTGPGPADGEFGPQTRASVESFQRWAKIKVDGRVGDRTWTVLLGEIAYDLEHAVSLDFVAG